MARQFFLGLLATIILLLSIQSTLATDSPNIAFVRKTCKDATYVDLCLNTLLPQAGRINSHPKKSTRLAIMAVTPQLQTTSNNITNLAKQPNLRTREVNSLNDCASNINNTSVRLQDATEVSNHLGGGTKGLKEAKRLSMENSVKSVVRVANSCVNNLVSLRARNDVTTRVQQATTPLVQVATNAVNLIHRMEF